MKEHFWRVQHLISPASLLCEFCWFPRQAKPAPVEFCTVRTGSLGSSTKAGPVSVRWPESRPGHMRGGVYRESTGGARRTGRRQKLEQSDKCWHYRSIYYLTPQTRWEELMIFGMWEENNSFVFYCPDKTVNCWLSKNHKLKKDILNSSPKWLAFRHGTITNNHSNE